MSLQKALLKSVENYLPGFDIEISYAVSDVKQNAGLFERRGHKSGHAERDFRISLYLTTHSIKVNYSPLSRRECVDTAGWLLRVASEHDSPCHCSPKEKNRRYICASVVIGLRRQSALL